MQGHKPVAVAREQWESLVLPKKPSSSAERSWSITLTYCGGNSRRSNDRNLGKGERVGGKEEEGNAVNQATHLPAGDKHFQLPSFQHESCISSYIPSCSDGRTGCGEGRDAAGGVCVAVASRRRGGFDQEPGPLVQTASPLGSRAGNASLAPGAVRGCSLAAARLGACKPPCCASSPFKGMTW